MLIKNARMGERLVDLRLSEQIEAIEPVLEVKPGEEELDARGCEVLSGFHDHHLHFFASLAKDNSVPCGPPLTADLEALKFRLRAFPSPGRWIRGFGYHESVAGEIDRFSLDLIVRDRPIRVQHRTGKMWILNTCACEELELARYVHLKGVETNKDGSPTGRLYRMDAWLRERTETVNQEAVGRYSEKLLGMGITSFTDASYTNNSKSLSYYRRVRAAGELKQKIDLMGDESLGTGFLKVMLDEDRFPVLDELVLRIKKAHDSGRGVAFHCVTHLELLFALESLRSAGSSKEDRVEHAALVSDDQIKLISERQVSIFTQPAFLRDKGDHYLKDIPDKMHQDLYRYQSLLSSGIPVFACSDAPYGPISPFEVVEAATRRETLEGQVISPGEVVSPEVALGGYLTKPGHSLVRNFDLKPGDPSDLCVLDAGWANLRSSIASIRVIHTLVDGQIVYSDSSANIS